MRFITGMVMRDNDTGQLAVATDGSANLGMNLFRDGYVVGDEVVIVKLSDFRALMEKAGEPL